MTTLSKQIVADYRKFVIERARALHGNSGLNESEAIEIIDALAAAQADTEALRAALKGLCDKLDLISNDPQYKSVWTLNHIHGGSYSGPNWSGEYTVARTLLDESLAGRKS